MPLKRPKRSQKRDTNASDERDRCQTPPYAVRPLLPYLPKDKIIWEPAAGEGHLARALQSVGYEVTITELLRGQNYFEPTHRPAMWDIQVTNPPWSTKYEWLAEAYRMGKPFALLVPLDTIAAGKEAQPLFKKHGIEVMLLNRRIDFGMPRVGFEGSNAHLNVIWLCWQLLPEKLMYGEIIKPPKRKGQAVLACMYDLQ